MEQNHEQPMEVEHLYRQVVEYNQKGDIYNAVKLCKLIARLAPDWSAPFAYLGLIYKSRNEWKPALHYCMIAVENNPYDETAWENLALSATALEEWEIARDAWNQLGFQFKKSDEALRLDLGIVPVRLNPFSQPEIVEVSRIDPARAFIQSIPQPSSGHRYKDLILIDGKPNSHYILYGQRIPVYDELQLLKPSAWRTYAALLHTSSINDVTTLANLCEEAELGFDNWSNATRFLRPNLHDKVSEYFDRAIFGEIERDAFLVAIAARKTEDVNAVLKNWQVISLKTFGGLERLF